MQNSEKIWQLVDARKEAYEGLSDRVWEIPEIAYTEYRSVAEHRAMLEQEGFRITESLAGIPTAVMGEAGGGGPVIAIVDEDDSHAVELADDVIRVPAVPEFLQPIVTVIPLQLLAYHAAILRGCDVDKPRNLAKSVTVE
jgi:hypothetical protein